MNAQNEGLMEWCGERPYAVVNTYIKKSDYR